MDWSWVRHPTQWIIRMSFSNSLSLVPIAWRLMVRSEFYNGAWVNLRSLYSEEKPALPLNWIDSFSLSFQSSYFIPLPPRLKAVGLFYLCLYSSSSLLIHIFGVLRTNTRLFYEWKTFPSSQTLFSSSRRSFLTPRSISFSFRPQPSIRRVDVSSLSLWARNWVRLRLS